MRRLRRRPRSCSELEGDRAELTSKNSLLVDEIGTLRAVDKELRETIARQEMDLEKQRKQLAKLSKQLQQNGMNGQGMNGNGQSISMDGIVCQQCALPMDHEDVELAAAAAEERERRD